MSEIRFSSNQIAAFFVAVMVYSMVAFLAFGVGMEDARGCEKLVAPNTGSRILDAFESSPLVRIPFLIGYKFDLWDSRGKCG